MDNIGNDDIVFNQEGVCNYCFEYEEKFKVRVVADIDREKTLFELKQNIIHSSKDKDYDCIIGVSGGVDSTYTAFKVKEMGLNPLAVHLDNGWNSELATHNIQKILETLNIDLYTHVIDWNEFKNLQLSFLKCSTPDGEIPTDHAISAILYKIASKYKIKYIISGNNFTTEGIMPLKWAYGHIDWKYIKSVHKIFGSSKISTFPRLSIWKLFWYIVFKRIKLVSILNYIDYDKKEAMSIIEKKLGWEYYGGKHYESNYTKFYQGHILPQKFKIDKRKLHLSALILSNQITRDEAIEDLQNPIYPAGQLERDEDYFRKKFNLSSQDYEKILNEKPKTFKHYPNNYKLLSILKWLVTFLRSKKMFHN